ncbi:MAG: hypothetical protein A2X49_10065 [Lentisphaerae bacterium GWF2_52_8]|nr:MAG: hypothetical protein A2X49_10065 [Lentisphaerae bacterium GWF2_52_8]
MENDLWAFEHSLSSTGIPVLHKHDSHEFFLCREGTGFQYTEKGATPMQPGDFFFFPEGQLHISGVESGQTSYVLVANLKEAYLSSSSEADSEAGLALRLLRQQAMRWRNKVLLSEKGARDIGLIFSELVEEGRQRRPGYRCAQKIAMLQMLLTVLREGQFAGERQGLPRPRGAERIEEACRLLESNYMYPVSVSQLIRQLNISRSHFHALFSQVTGKSMLQYLNAIRVREALRILKEGDPSTAKIAAQCGFRSVSHFYYVLRMETGRSMRDLRSNAGLRSKISG